MVMVLFRFRKLVVAVAFGVILETWIKLFWGAVDDQPKIAPVSLNGRLCLLLNTFNQPQIKDQFFLKKIKRISA